MQSNISNKFSVRPSAETSALIRMEYELYRRECVLDERQIPSLNQFLIELIESSLSVEPEAEAAM